MDHIPRDPQAGELLTGHADYSAQEKTMRLTFTKSSEDPVIVTLSVDASPGCGGIVWPAGQILSNYLVQRDRSFLQHKTVLELGSGTGLVGIVAASLGAQVWVTDQAYHAAKRTEKPSHFILYCRRTELVLFHHGSSPLPSHRDFDLGENRYPLVIPVPDVVLAADCVYFEPAFPLLVQTLCDIYDKKPEVLFCYKKRRKADKRFFALLKKKFTWEQVMDDPDREVYNRDSITLQYDVLGINLAVEGHK
ncbi:putative methyltransferase-domain-containing protein [Armillaria novae-zelandiae]|uniref:Methyltransferase-domain-containing protein n=1 Tax=Armillaria novae-zelandiae TaxID=153914 RepID=A0AA39PW14_9AGAR|nr:putative methyltransferase-domain-containing protein [Armillaria novae-zelandiae]